jgi:hypothetical protein
MPPARPRHTFNRRNHRYRKGRGVLEQLAPRRRYDASETARMCNLYYADP